jgi:hypothetical protein
MSVHDLRHEQTVSFHEYPDLCSEGLFALAEEKQALAIGCAAGGLPPGDEPVRIDRNVRRYGQGQGTVGLSHRVVPGTADNSLQRCEAIAKLFCSKKSVIRPRLMDQALQALR